MKREIVSSGIAGLITALLLLLERHMHSTTLLYVAYAIVPFVFMLYVMQYSKFAFTKLIQHGIALLLYGIVVTTLEAVVYEFWKIQITPAGDEYSRYALDALYPGFGLLILVFVFFVSCIILVLANFVRGLGKKFLKSQ